MSFIVTKFEHFTTEWRLGRLSPTPKNFIFLRIYLRSPEDPLQVRVVDSSPVAVENQIPPAANTLKKMINLAEY